MEVPGQGGEASPRVRAAALAITLGGFGVHKFYLGYTWQGAIMAAISVLSFLVFVWIPWGIGIIEGVMYLRKTDEEFERRYLENRRGWF